MNFKLHGFFSSGIQIRSLEYVFLFLQNHFSDFTYITGSLWTINHIINYEMLISLNGQM